MADKEIPLPPDHDEATKEPELTDVYYGVDDKDEGDKEYRERVRDRSDDSDV
jgi:hypothetical protein